MSHAPLQYPDPSLSDLRARLGCVSATWTVSQLLHPGNVAWSHSRGDGSTAPDTTLSWGSPLTGFADIWQGQSPQSAADVSLHVSPRANAGTRSRIVQELLSAWPAMTLQVSRQDLPLVEALAAAGFRDVDGPWFAQLWRALGDLSDLEQHIVAPGYEIRPVAAGDPSDVAARVQIHRQAWAPARIKGLLGLELTGHETESSYSLDKHHAVMASPGYRPELDLVAVGPDGDLVAYALGWLDAPNKSLLFEPVGTHPAHSGKGLARAVCARMLHTARQLGATQAVVGPRGDTDYPLPRRVYEGLGMHEVAQFVSMTSSSN